MEPQNQLSCANFIFALNPAMFFALNTFSICQKTPNFHPRNEFKKYLFL